MKPPLLTTSARQVLELVKKNPEGTVADLLAVRRFAHMRLVAHLLLLRNQHHISDDQLYSMYRLDAQVAHEVKDALQAASTSRRRAPRPRKATGDPSGALAAAGGVEVDATAPDSAAAASAAVPPASTTSDASATSSEASSGTEAGRVPASEVEQSAAAPSPGPSAMPDEAVVLLDTALSTRKRKSKNPVSAGGTAQSPAGEPVGAGGTGPSTPGEPALGESASRDVAATGGAGGEAPLPKPARTVSPTVEQLAVAHLEAVRPELVQQQGRDLTLWQAQLLRELDKWDKGGPRRAVSLRAPDIARLTAYSAGASLSDVAAVTAKGKRKPVKLDTVLDSMVSGLVAGWPLDMARLQQDFFPGGSESLGLADLEPALRVVLDARADQIGGAAMGTYSDVRMKLLERSNLAVVMGQQEQRHGGEWYTEAQIRLAKYWLQRRDAPSDGP